jgi:hypothetical protein
LYVEATAGTSLAGAIAETAGQNAVLPSRARRGWFHDFSFALPQDAPSEESTLTLSYREVGSANLLRVATELDVIVVGSPVEPATSVAFAIGAQDRLPERTATLWVRPVSAYELHLVGWLPDQMNRPLRLTSIAPLDVAPDSFTDPMIYLDALRNAVHDFAGSDPGNVTRWFDAILSHYGDGCRFIVVDEAESQIPWEMFRVSGRLLGARAVVVRWTEVQFGSRSIKFQTEEANCRGRVAAYEADEVGLAGGGTDSMPGGVTVRLLASPDDLQDDLLAGESPVGLVYVSSGRLVVYGDEDHATLRIVREPNILMQSVTVRFDDIEGLEPRPLFFVNAPYSGRIWRNNLRPAGLLRSALAQVAAGFIGALGPVDRRMGSQIARRLLDGAQRPEGIAPAELLHVMRAEVAERVMDPRLTPLERQAARRELVSLFLYVFYGNPSARLFVRAASRAANLSLDCAQ